MSDEHFTNRTPDALLEELLGVLDKLAPQDRAAFVAKLSEILPPPPGLTLSALTLKMLGIAPDTPLDANRLAPCLSALIEFLVKMDDAAWGAWKGLGSDSKSLKREIQMRPLLKALLKGHSKLTVKHVEYQIANLMRLSVELLGQISKVGVHVSQHLRTPQAAPQIQRAFNKAITKTVAIMVKIQRLPV